MEENNGKDLIRDYLGRRTSGEEDAIVESWYVQLGMELPPVPDDFDYQDKKDRIWAKIQQGRRPVVKRPRLWPRLVAAAAILCVLAGTVYFFTGRNNPKTENSYANDIPPGGNGATLTLANGKKIKLGSALKGELAREAGVSISKSADGQLIYTVEESIGTGSHTAFNTLSTEKGETYQVRLPDGSLVWLNAASTLKYPADFTALDKRRVELSGEAYFEVARDKKHPFVVKTPAQEVEVLGTHFNVEAYGDEKLTRTTLAEGSVKLSAGAGVKEKVLKPDEQAVYQGGAFEVRKVDAQDAIAWNKGLFVFEDEPLESVMRKIARWYNVEVVYQDVDKNRSFYGSMSRYDKVSRVLDGLQLTNGAHFKIEGRRITVMK